MGGAVAAILSSKCDSDQPVMTPHLFASPRYATTSRDKPRTDTLHRVTWFRMFRRAAQICRRRSGSLAQTIECDTHPVGKFSRQWNVKSSEVKYHCYSLPLESLSAAMHRGRLVLTDRSVFGNRRQRGRHNHTAARRTWVASASEYGGLSEICKSLS